MRRGTGSLAPGEVLLVDARPHWARVIPAALAAPVIVGGTSFLVAVVPAGGYRTDLRAAIAGAGLVLAILACLRPWLRWRTTRYLVTDRRVAVRSGVLGRRGRDMPLRAVTDVSFRRSLLERLLGSGTVVLDASGERLELPDVRHPEAVHRVIGEGCARVWTAAGAPGPAGPPPERR